MRIFVGIKINEDIRCKIEEWGREFLMANAELLINSKIPNQKIRIIKPENLHITLVPPWEIKKEDVKFISNKLKVVSFEPFEIKFDKVEFAPNPKNPRQIWTIGKATLALIQLKEMIYPSLTSLKLGRTLLLSKDDRQFRLHCTLARFRQPLPPLNFSRDTFSTLGEDKVEWAMKVESFVLYESKLLPEGAEYEVVEEFELGSKNHESGSKNSH